MKFPGTSGKNEYDVTRVIIKDLSKTFEISSLLEPDLLFKLQNGKEDRPYADESGKMKIKKEWLVLLYFVSLI